MKATLKILMLVLGAAFPLAAFAGMIGLASPAAFLSSELMFSLFAIVGLAAIGLNDYSRRPLTVRVAAKNIVPAAAPRSSRHDAACAVRPVECASA
ncbi:MAG TPA: hypothetical protein VLT83_13585 [Opitutaceae bacterium]|nr:hypothetical protein [Opitutaceae bacterium]